MTQTWCDPLWPSNAPGAVGDETLDRPSLTYLLPDPQKATGAAVVVLPGGGYGGHAAHEAEPVAEWLNTLGIAGIVLRYRLGPRYRHPAMLDDAARAVRTVRSQAEKLRLDPAGVGILGFSAGGHLALTLATYFDSGNPAAEDPIERFSSRPDLAVLIYPLVTMLSPLTHSGSRKNLLGDDPDESLVRLFSNELQVTRQTSPTFLVHGNEDAGVPIENSLQFAAALRANGVPFEAHFYEGGPHGFGMGGNDPSLGAWPGLCAAWLKRRGF